MIVKLIGIIDSILEDRVYLDVSGIVYEIITPTLTLGKLPVVGEKCTLKIKHITREDGQILYGFITEDEKYWFTELTKISGLGPKFAINILSAISPSDIYLAIASRDENKFTIANGIGKKLAARIITELSSGIDKLLIPTSFDKINVINNKSSINSKSTEKSAKDTRLSDAIDALTKLGFTKSNFYQILTQKLMENPDISSEDLIKYALSNVAMV